MKKALFKLAAIFLSVCLMLSAGITFSADETTDTIATYLAEKNYICTDTIFDGNGELGHTRIKEYYNWAGTAIANTDFIEDLYGIQRLEANGSKYAYITMNIDSPVEFIKIGMVVAKSLTEADNFYYTSSDGEKWLPITPSHTCVSERNENYDGVEDLISNMPADTKYLRIVTYNPSYWWGPLMDYIKIYDLDVAADQSRYENALNDYSATANTKIETYADFTANTEISLGTNNLKNASDSTRNYRSDNNFMVLSSDNTTGWLAFKVDSSNAIETTTVFDERNASNKAQMSINFYYTTVISDTNSIVWNKLPTTSIAKSEGSKLKADGATSLGDYTAYTYRLFNLPEDIKALKIEIGSRSWAPTIDYIDIYDVDISKKPTGYSKTTIVESYTDFTANTEISLGTNNLKNASDSTRNYRSDNNFMVLSSDNTTGWLAFKVDSSNIIDTTVVFDESPSNKAAMSIDFYYSTDISDTENIVWNELPYTSVIENISSVKENGGALTSPYVAHNFRLVDLPENSVAIKFEIGSKSWAPTIDYIDIYEVDKLENAFSNYELTEVHEYFVEAKIDAEVVEHQGVTAASAGLGTVDNNYIKADTVDGGYVVINVEDNNVVETGLVIHRGQLNTTSLTFYTSPDNKTYTQVPAENIISSLVNCATKASTPDTVNYYLRRQGLTNLPDGTKYLKVFINTTQAWQPGLDYITVYDAVEVEEQVCTHANAFEQYNPIKNLVEKYCADEECLVIKGNANKDNVLDICDLVSINNAITDTTDIDLFAAETDGVDGISDGDVAWLRKELLNR